MEEIDERNLIWNLLELLIEKHKLKNESEFLEPSKDKLIFGNFVEGHPMCFEGDFRDMVTELRENLPTDYEIVKDYLIDDASGIIGIIKI